MVAATLRAKAAPGLDLRFNMEGRVPTPKGKGGVPTYYLAKFY